MSPEEREKERERKMPFIVATYVYASSQGQRTHSARNNYLNQEQYSSVMVQMSLKTLSHMAVT
jgi:hypothetical protein